MKLSDIMVNDAIVPELEARNKEDAVAELVSALADAGAISKSAVEEVTAAILKRESQATTGIGKGVALPHAKLKGVKKPVGTIGCSSEGLDFAALDTKPVYSVILLLSSPDNPDEHLQAMETIFRHVQRDIFRKFLRQSQTREAVIELIEEADELG
jgi:mannitol/fructose-specific phosphotransferase system IIA component (Ntr-type)